MQIMILFDIYHGTSLGDKIWLLKILWEAIILESFARSNIVQKRVPITSPKPHNRPGLNAQ